MAYGITDRSQLIDISGIHNALAGLETTAEKFKKCAEIIDNAANILDAKTLAIDKTTMQPQLFADADYIESMQYAVEGFTDAVRDVAMQVHAAQEAELNDYIAKQKAAQAAAQQQAQQSGNNGTI